MAGWTCPDNDVNIWGGRLRAKDPIDEQDLVTKRYADDNASQWIDGSSGIYYNEGSVNIGTTDTSSDSKLYVYDATDPLTEDPRILQSLISDITFTGAFNANYFGSYIRLDNEDLTQANPRVTQKGIYIYSKIDGGANNFGIDIDLARDVGANQFTYGLYIANGGGGDGVNGILLTDLDASGMTAVSVQDMPFQLATEAVAYNVSGLSLSGDLLTGFRAAQLSNTLETTGIDINDCTVGEGVLIGGHFRELQTGDAGALGYGVKVTNCTNLGEESTFYGAHITGINGSALGYGVYIEDVNANDAGGDAYGLYIGTVSAPDKNYGIYQADDTAENVLLGSLDIRNSLQCDSIVNDTGLAAGTYTPTLTNVANLSASTAYACQYMRVGNTVTVSGKVDIDPTLTATLTQLGISLPIASNFANAEECGGTAFASGIAAQGAAIRADAANNRAELVYISGDVTNQPMYFSFTYRVI